MTRQIDNMDYHYLEQSKENWVIGCIVLIIIVATVVVSTLAYSIGSYNAEYGMVSAIKRGGYEMTYVKNSTNDYYIIEKRNR